MMTTEPNYNTIEDLQLRKHQLQADIDKKTEAMGGLWHELITPKPSSTKGELVANLISNSITAIDAFLLVRKLTKRYGWLFGRRRR